MVDVVGVRHRVDGARELRYSADSVVVVAGVPGAGKSTLLRRLFPGDSAVRVFDSERIRNRWMPVLGVLPYAWWRPLVHVTYYVSVLRAMRRDGGPMVVHDCATRPWVRQLLGWRAKRAGLPLHLVLLDVPGDVARDGQWVRGRIVRAGSMATHCRRWPGLLAKAADDPSHVVPGAASAVVLNRRQANQLESISFGRKLSVVSD
ncbi:AAA family ATPase [Kribbella sp. NPDC026596]|uniref:AAA family ATPase n=1 Tax=Kribbella sp. NPDC026596 TaxID=3155122 RepID=UPI0033FA70C1